MIDAVWSSGAGQADHQGAAAAGGVLEVELAPDRLGEAPRHGQAESDPGAVGRVAEALERAEHQVAVGGPDTRSVVDDPDVHPPGDGTGLHPHRSARPVEEGVVDEVGHHPLDEYRVGLELGDRRVDDHLHALCPGPEAGQGGIDEFGDVG